MKYLGIDFGKRKIGIAISDDSGKVAFAREILENNKDIFKKITQLVEEEKIKIIVVGESKDYKGGENPVMVDTKKFAQKLKELTGCEIVYHPEYLSSMEAGRIIDDRKDDARAAAIVLQSYLDKKNSS